MSPHRVLFLCTGNSARSQMAEALLRTMSKGQVDSFSAGTDPRPLHPLAIKSIQEIGIDISEQKSKALQQYLDQEFDFVISVCARAAQECPQWPRSREQNRWSIDDPAEATGSEDKLNYVISVCARAAETCPVWPRAQEQIRWHFDDPAAVAGSEEEQLRVFRRVRNEVRQRLSLAILANKVPATLPEVAKE